MLFGNAIRKMRIGKNKSGNLKKTLGNKQRTNITRKRQFGVYKIKLEHTNREKQVGGSTNMKIQVGKVQFGKH